MNPVPPRPLLRRSPLQPGESLPSLLARLAELNCYSRSLLFSLCFEAGKVGRSIRRLDNDEHPVMMATYERLAVLTGLPPADLSAATIHHYVLPLTPPHLMQRMMAFSRQNLPHWAIGHLSGFRASPRAQFCPVCLKEAAYHRLIWTPLAMAACVHHARLLVSRCPQCERALSIESIVKTRCQTCGADLLEAPSRSLTDDEFGLFAQRMLWAWLEGNSRPICAWATSLPAHPPAVLYSLVKGLKDLMFGRLDHAALAPQPTEKTVWRAAEEVPWVQYELNRLALRAATNWPTGLFDFARRLNAGTVFADSCLSPYTAEDGPTIAFYATRAQREWAWPEFEFVHKLLSRAGLPLAKRKSSRNNYKPTWPGLLGGSQFR